MIRNHRYHKVSEIREMIRMIATKADLKQAVQNYRELAMMQEEINSQLEAIKKEISGYMESENLEEFIGDDYKVTWKTQQRSSLAPDLLIPVLGEDLSPFKKTSTYHVLRVR